MPLLNVLCYAVAVPCSQVWLADWLGCQVAVKELMGLANGRENNEKAWQELRNEVKMLGTYNHPNITRFLAVCLDPPMICMQYYAHGSLFDLLQVGFFWCNSGLLLWVWLWVWVWVWMLLEWTDVISLSSCATLA